MSFSAKAFISVLRFFKKAGFFPDLSDDLDSEIAKSREYNQKHRYRQPTDHKALYETVRIGSCPVLVIHPKPNRKATASERGRIIMFLHGGGDSDTWKPEIPFARTYANRTGADVYYPIYPPFTETSVRETAELIFRIYAELTAKFGAENIAVIGGSYGGFLAMQLITWINREKKEADMPRLMLLNSPFAFPETAEEWEIAHGYEKTDPMIPEGALRFMLDGILRADAETPDFLLYPRRMDFRHAPETYVFYTEEVCVCAANGIREAYERDGAGGKLHLHIEPGMMHCYACAPVFPESRRDFGKQISLIRAM